MSYKTSTFLLVGILSVLSHSQTAGKPPITAQQLMDHWRIAMHARPAKAAELVSESNEDGIPGTIEEWISGDAFRSETKRAFDESSVLVGTKSAQLRDWNGWVREVQGEELKRLRTEIAETSALILGPPAWMSQGNVTLSDDKKSYLLQVTPPGGVAMTWSIDANSWLPVKSVRPGEDSEIATSYSDWQSNSGVLTPQRGEVSETDKPDYTWQRKEVKFPDAAIQIAVALRPGPQDAFLQPTAAPIPFTMEANHIVFKASVNGREPIGFILDTGADQNVINESRLAALGLKPYAKTMTTGGGGSAEYSYAQDCTITFPGGELRKQHVAIIDQSGLERALGIPLGGLLGYDFICRYVIEIDYEKMLLTLHDRDNWTYSGKGAVVPIIFDVGIPFMHGSISVPTKPDLAAFLVLDFGAAETMTLTSPFVKANDLVRLAQTNATVNRPAGLDNQFFSQNNVRGHVDQLTIGDLTVKQIPINMSVNTKGAYASSTFAGTVGEGIYRRYHVFLDYARNRVIFEPTPEAAKPFPERQTYGLTLLASGADLHTYTVAAVRAGSPAESDGFKKGDVIAAVDGKPSSQFLLSELRDWLMHGGQHHEVQVTRGGQKQTVPVTVRLISLDQR